MVRRLKNKKLEFGMKEATVAYYKELCRHYPARTEQNDKKFRTKENHTNKMSRESRFISLPVGSH
jgi:hypothetical protein